MDARKAVVNGVEVLLFEGKRVPAEAAPEGYPHRYETRHPDGDESIPATVEDGSVRVNFFGTLFSKEPLLGPGAYCNVRSLSIEGGPEYDTMEGVCPGCGEILLCGDATMRDGQLSIAVSCPCGFSGTEEHDVTGILSETDESLSELPEDDGALTDVPTAASFATGGEAVLLPSYPVAGRGEGTVTLSVPMSGGETSDVVLLTRFDEIRRG